MNNSDEPSNINKENIHNLLSEIEDMNKFQSKIQHNIHEILNLCDLIDSINCDLNNFNIYPPTRICATFYITSSQQFLHRISKN